MFDYARSLAHLNNDSDLLDELITVFIVEMPAHYEKLTAALESKQAEPLSRTAHLLKGSLGAIGAMQVMQSAQALEFAAKECNWVDISQYAERFDKEYRLLLEALHRRAS